MFLKQFSAIIIINIIIIIVIIIIIIIIIIIKFHPFYFIYSEHWEGLSSCRVN